MEEKRLKILKERDENLFALQITNTTSQTQYINLFNSDNLTPIVTNPTITTPANSPLSTIPTGFGQRFTAINTNNNQVFSTSQFNDLVSVYDDNNTLVTTISIGVGNTSTFIVYNPLNNCVYVATGVFPTYNVLKIIDCNTYSIINTSILPAPMGVFDVNTLNNTLYIPLASLNSVLVFDCNTNTIITTISPINGVRVCSYNQNNNCIYTNDTILNTINKIDCNTNTYIPLGISVPSTINLFPLSFNPNTNKLYGSGNASFTYFEIDTNTDTLTNLVPTIFGFNAISCAVDYFENVLYVPIFSNNLLIYDLNTNTLLSNTNYGFSNTQGITFSPNNRRMYISTIFTNLFVFTSVNVYSSNYFIQGVYDYNAFINNLNNEPISIQLIRLTTQNQDQLNNPIQITKIDSSGIQTFYSELPITKIDSEQSQVNIADIPFEDIIFDGRTYINQYQLDPYEIVRFGIYYKQLDLTTASRTIPMLFKKKIPLKEYIIKQLNL